jgi:hypothetical protein
MVSPGTATPAAASGPNYQNPPGTPSAPAAASAGIKVTPRMLAIGGLVLAIVVVAAVVFMNMSSNPGGITFSSSTISCSATVPVTETIRLPSSVRGTDQITLLIDGVVKAKDTVSREFIQQSDGSWSNTTPVDVSSGCGSSSMGVNDLKIVDASGHILATGTYTLTP